jgi:hypothetical protein
MHSLMNNKTIVCGQKTKLFSPNKRTKAGMFIFTIQICIYHKENYVKQRVSSLIIKIN